MKVVDNLDKRKDPLTLHVEGASGVGSNYQIIK